VKITNNQAWRLITRTIGSWHADYAQSMGAALAFYTMFSVAPLLLIVLSVAGYFFGAKAARGEIVSELSNLTGSQSARAIEGLIASANEPSHRTLVAGIGIVIFLIGATSVFNELQDSLNRIWRAPRSLKSRNYFSLVRSRLLSFGMILAIAFLLMVSLLVSAGLSAVGKLWGPTSLGWVFVAQFSNVLLSFVLITVMFALIYKIIPQRTVHWRDVWIGAGTTSALFTIGKLVIGIYVGRSSMVSAFGGVGSLAVFLLWVYYSAQIFLLGAEFTWVYSTTFGGAAKSEDREKVAELLLGDNESQTPIPTRRPHPLSHHT
jgi:membrane protein